LHVQAAHRYQDQRSFHSDMERGRGSRSVQSACRRLPSFHGNKRTSQSLALLNDDLEKVLLARVDLDHLA
jgi:hypothetical protein